MVFTGDTIFSECQTWLMGSNVTEWLAALDMIAKPGVDWVVPDHGEVVTIDFSPASAPTSSSTGSPLSPTLFAKGWTREERPSSG